jgi:hypothetical protein
MKKFYITTLVVYALFVIHLVEEMLRESGEFDFSVFIPLIFYPVSLIGMYLNKRWGFWTALVLNILMVLITGIGHFNPNSHDFVQVIYSHWGGLTGIVAAKIAALVPATALAAVWFGIQAVKSNEISK